VQQNVICNLVIPGIVDFGFDQLFGVNAALISTYSHVKHDSTALLTPVDVPGVELVPAYTTTSQPTFGDQRVETRVSAVFFNAH